MSAPLPPAPKVIEDMAGKARAFFMNCVEKNLEEIGSLPLLASQTPQVAAALCLAVQAGIAVGMTLHHHVVSADYGEALTWAMPHVVRTLFLPPRPPGQ